MRIEVVKFEAVEDGRASSVSVAELVEEGDLM
jgi:hypothetical protein